MFVLFYTYCVPRKNVDRFMYVQREAAKVLVEHGALSDETFVPDDLSPEYGLQSYPEVLNVSEDEELFIALTRFLSQEHHDEVMGRFNNDPRTNALFEYLTTFLDLKRITHGKFRLLS